MSIGMNRDIYKTIQRNRRNDNMYRGLIAGINTIPALIQRRREQDAAMGMAGQVGIDPAAARFVSPSLMAQAVVNMKLAADAQKRRDAEQQAEFKFRRELASDEFAARRAADEENDARTATREQARDAEYFRRIEAQQSGMDRRALQDNLFEAAQGFGAGIRDLGKSYFGALGKVGAAEAKARGGASIPGVPQMTTEEANYLRLKHSEREQVRDRLRKIQEDLTNPQVTNTMTPQQRADFQAQMQNLLSQESALGSEISTIEGQLRGSAGMRQFSIEDALSQLPDD